MKKNIWTDQDLLKLDQKFAEENIAFHARPMRAAIELMGGLFSLDLLDNDEAEFIIAAYQRLIPETDTIWPGMGIGIAASVDQVRKITAGVGFGRPILSLETVLNFDTDVQALQWCRHDPDIAAKGFFSGADLHDFTYGIDDLRESKSIAIRYWHLALSNLEDVANILSTGYSTASVIQPICMTAELSIKAALLYCDVDPDEVRKFSHQHKAMAARLSVVKKHRDDIMVESVVTKLPSYVGTRYDLTNLTRLDIVKLALGVQFVAASSVRRLTDRDFAAQLEHDSWPGVRKSFF
ncbi:hypothetical protein [Herbaspirillum sp. NPDC101396]|uniref:hypothetical protein n=1 Tax=Herbaspirillum sp. NPDC101396 TaxID=3364005 RepID=UPI00383B9D24